LLSHSSGLQRDIEELTDQELGHSYISLSEIVELINRSSLVFKPGERWLYSNLGYALAAAIIESVTQKDFATALKTLIFDPLLMRHTGHETNFDLIENRASGYVQLPDGIIKAGYEDKSYVIGAGSIYSTVGDLLIWSRELMNGNLLSKANIKRLYTRQSGRYSYGWFVDSYVWPPVNDDHTAVNLHHDGGSPGFEANLSLLIRHKSVVIILTNKLPSYFQGLSNRITNVYLGFDETPPKADGSKELFDQLFNRSLESAKALIEQWQKSDRKNLVPDKNAIFQIGRAYLDSEQLERASLTFSLISELVPKWWMPYLFYGIAMEKMGKKEEAIKLYNQVLELKPDQSNAASRLAKLKK
ncbi:MAG: serine hydrolase, partial [Calditrichaeota bacterium]|nr:serine hydrolase [Calditrichota bacterium]